MDISLSKSQRMLLKSARDFLKKDCKELAREAEGMQEGYSPEKWSKISDLGWLGIGIDEEYGGTGGTSLDHVVILQEMGRHLFPGPYIASGICTATILNEFGQSDCKQELLPPMTDGELIVVPALQKPEPHLISDSLAMFDRLEAGENGEILFSGMRLFVPYGCSADYYLVQPGEQTGMDSLQAPFWLVEARESGGELHPLKTIAHDQQSEVIFDRVPIPRDHFIGEPQQAETIGNRLRDIGALAHSAYILGMLEQVLEMTVEYAKSRVQFGKPIGQFQVIQHQCADMLTEIEQVRFLTYQAAWKSSQGLPATKEISMAKALASDASRDICLAGVKIHGGIGIIDEYDMQHYLRRAKAMELAFGDADTHREIVAQQLGL